MSDSDFLWRIVALTAVSVLLLTAVACTPASVTAADPAPVCELSEADIQQAKPVLLTPDEFQRFSEWSTEQGHVVPGDRAYRMRDADPTSPKGSLAVMVIVEGCVEMVVHPFAAAELDYILGDKPLPGGTKI
jgi:hypothetical protein